MKSWVISTQNTILLYCPFLFIENFTFLSSISFHVWLTTTSKSSKREDAKGFSISNIPFALYFIWEILASPFCSFLSEEYERIYYSYWSSLLLNKIQAKQKKTTQQKQKWYNLTTESLLSNNTSNRFKIIMNPTRRKNL